MSKNGLTRNLIPEANEPEKFLTVLDVASLLSVRPSTVYQWASLGEIPHYRLGRIVRFRRTDLDAWVDGHRKEGGVEEKKAREIIKSMRGHTQDIDRIVKKSIDRIVKKSIAEAKGNRYTPSLEKPGKDKGLRKEGNYGLI